ncbi:MAG: bifunctional phosphoglucose/phosphomannose isomerase [Candidatus Micrarchaeota archaeon]
MEWTSNPFDLTPKIKLQNVDKVIIAGVGGSAFAGEVIATLCHGQLNVEVHRDYGLPKVNVSTLVIACSYSGNTEETLSSLSAALKTNCQVIGIASGGELEQQCKLNSIPFVKVPSGMQPRNATLYMTIPILELFASNGLIEKIDYGELKESVKSESLKTQGKQIAERIYGKTPLIYSSQRLKCVSMAWKIAFNENAKMHAFHNQLPELNHNEIVGYTKKSGNFHTLIIRDKDDSERNQKRFTITEKLIRDFGSECTVIETQGTTFANRLFSTIQLGYWTSFYLAKKNGVDPEPVVIVERLKMELKN